MAYSEQTIEKAIRALRERGPMRASDLGWELWGETTEVPDRGDGSHKQNKFCRPAGKILRELDRQGKVVWRTHGTCILWEAL